MNDFLIKEIEKAYNDINRGYLNSYNNSTVRQDVIKAMGRIETIISLLKDKTIVVEYKGDKN